jgi:hypothetical protein
MVLLTAAALPLLSLTPWGGGVRENGKGGLGVERPRS